MDKVQKSVLVPIPRYGFDPTETSIPWRYFKDAGHTVSFATPDGTTGQADLRMLTGQDLGLLKMILMASPEAVDAYREMEQSPEFKKPLPYSELLSADYDALFLPGGHDKGMKEYLESETLKRIIVEFFKYDKAVGAICHGTLLAGRSVSPETGKSVLWGRKTTGLTKFQELTAYTLTRTYLGDYYRTYPEITMEDELRSYLWSREDFFRGPGFPIPIGRDNPFFLGCGFTVLDGNYLSARWPGDAHRFGRDFLELCRSK